VFNPKVGDAYALSVIPTSAMFTSTGLFGGTPCPKATDCELTNCIFSHELQQNNGSETNGSKIYDPLDVVPDLSPPPAKRRKIEPQDDTPPAMVTRPQQTTLRVPRAEGLRSMIKNAKSNVPTEPAVQTLTLENGISSPKASILIKSTTKPVSPPPISARKTISSEPSSRSSTPGPVPKESLIPRPVKKPPALHSVRNQSLQMLFAAMMDLNKQAARGSGKSQGLSLTMNEVTKLALDEEEQNALNCEGDAYRHTMGRRIQGLKKMQLPEWLNFLSEKLKKTFPPATTATLVKLPSKTGSERKFFSSGLPSAHEETIILRRLRTPLDGLEAFGYVTSPPSDSQISSAKAANLSAAGYEKCDRCDTRFQVFPGRNDAGQLTTGGKCIHHWGKIVRPPRGQTSAQDAHYSCCNAVLGTVGCSTASTHVFNVKDPARLAAVLQFERTPPNPDKKMKAPVTFDCEMAYTTLGLELIRLTAVSWPIGDLLLDVLVRPYGEILDLNTRFSGVSSAQWASAISHSPSTSTLDIDLTSEPLSIVSTPAVARQMLFSLLTPNTPLIGHAIDNDLNSCRIIHPFIIDTVLLFPHPKGLPIRFGLKMLAGKHLSRGIQLGGEDGHDSKEDALATGDLCRWRVAEEWKGLRANGWRFVEGTLVGPEGESGMQGEGDRDMEGVVVEESD
jgi:hypothetical protein